MQEDAKLLGGKVRLHTPVGGTITNIIPMDIRNCHNALGITTEHFQAECSCFGTGKFYGTWKVQYVK